MQSRPTQIPLIFDRCFNLRNTCISQKEIDEMKNTMHTHEDRLTNTNRDIERVTCTQREPVDGIDYVENQTRRNNLRIDGVAEVTAETWADTEVVSLNRLSVGCGATPRRQSGYLVGFCLFIRVICTMLPPHGHCRNLYFL